MASRRGQEEPVRRTHIEDGLEIPDHLEGVTFDQKKRLARLAKMGLGPVAKPLSVEKPRQVTATPAAANAGDGSHPVGDALQAQQQQLERRAALLERERRMRLELQRQEEAEQRHLEEKEKQRQEREKAARARAGLKSLGPVQPREESSMPKPTVGYPLPAPVYTPEPARPPAKLEVKLYASTVERVASSTGDAAEEQVPSKRRFREVADEVEDDEIAGGQEASSSTAPAVQRRSQPQKAEKRSLVDEKRRRKAKKKKKRRGSSGSEEEKSATEDEAGEEEAKVSKLSDFARKQARDGGISWNMMHVESVKGKVSNANKGFTDADLERRFGPRETVSAGSLMTEEQVLAIMRKDRKGKSESDWAMRRAQKELAEWTEIKAQRMARTSEEKERLVVSGRAGSKLG